MGSTCALRGYTSEKPLKIVQGIREHLGKYWVVVFLLSQYGSQSWKPEPPPSDDCGFPQSCRPEPSPLWVLVLFADVSLRCWAFKEQERPIRENHSPGAMAIAPPLWPDCGVSEFLPRWTPPVHGLNHIGNSSLMRKCLMHQESSSCMMGPMMRRETSWGSKTALANQVELSENSPHLDNMHVFNWGQLFANFY